MKIISILLLVYLTSVKGDYTQSWVMSKNLPHYTYPQNILVNSLDEVYNIALYKRVVVEPAVKGNNLLISKINSGGTLQWVQEYPSTYSETISSSIIDKDDNIYILIGYNSKYYVRKYNGDGNIMYEKEIDKNGKLYNGDDYIYQASSLTFSGYNVKAIISKYNLNFNKIKTHEIAEAAGGSWAIKYYIKDMKIDNNNNLIVSGQRGSCNRHYTCTNNNFWLMKFINDSPDWFFIKEGSNDDISLSLMIDSSNNIYIHGKTKSSLYYYGTSPLGNSKYRGFLVKYDTHGNFLRGEQPSTTTSTATTLIPIYDYDSPVINEVNSEIILWNWVWNQINYDITLWNRKYNIDLSSKEAVSYSYTNQDYGSFKVMYSNQWDAYVTLSNDHNLVTIKFSDSSSPTLFPTKYIPSMNPIPVPSTVPTLRPSTVEPSFKPTLSPSTVEPTFKPTIRPSTMEPSFKPTLRPSTVEPSPKPTLRPSTTEPLSKPTLRPSTVDPSFKPSLRPSVVDPTVKPTLKPSTLVPTAKPTLKPSTLVPTFKPTLRPSTLVPTFKPTGSPTKRPNRRPHPPPRPSQPTLKPTVGPTKRPTRRPSPPPRPSPNPTFKPTVGPTKRPNRRPHPPPRPSQPTLKPSIESTYVQSPRPVSKPTLSPIETITFNYLCTSNEINNVDMNIKKFIQIYIYNKELIGESLELNLLKNNEIIYIIDDAKLIDVPDDYIWIIPDGIKSSDSYNFEIKSKNDGLETDKCNTNTFQIINPNSDSTNDSSITLTHILLLVIIIILLCICFGIYYGFKFMTRNNPGEERQDDINVVITDAIPVVEQPGSRSDQQYQS